MLGHDLVKLIEGSTSGSGDLLSKVIDCVGIQLRLGRHL